MVRGAAELLGAGAGEIDAEHPCCPARLKTGLFATIEVRKSIGVKWRDVSRNFIPEKAPASQLASSGAGKTRRDKTRQDILENRP